MTHSRLLWIGLATCFIAACAGGGDDSPPPKDPDAQSSDVDALNSILTQPPSSSASSGSGSGSGGSATSGSGTTSSGLPIITAQQIAACANLPEMSPVDMSRAGCLVGAFDGILYDIATNLFTTEQCHSEFTAAGRLTVSTNSTRTSQTISAQPISNQQGSTVMHGTRFLGFENIPNHSVFSITNSDQTFFVSAVQLTNSKTGQKQWSVWSSIVSSVSRKERLICAAQPL